LLAAGIGRFPLPLMHRAVVIEMQRYDGSGELKRFAGRDPVIDYIFGRLRSWASEVELDAEPQLPPQLRNRQADNWRPLIAIADTFGPEWDRLARDAAIEFARAHQDEDPAVLMLNDIRCIFDQRRVDRLSSKALVAALNDIDDSMWCEWRGPRGDQQPRGLSQGGLAQMLMPFAIRPRTIWPPDRIARRSYWRRPGPHNRFRRRPHQWLYLRRFLAERTQCSLMKSAFGESCSMSVAAPL
jgi:hypothetical protein